MEKQPGLTFYTSMFVLVAATLLLHEASHWLAGRVLGYEMWFTLTRAGPLAGAWRNATDYALVSAAGPAFTVSMGMAGAWLAIRHRHNLGYELVFTALMQRFMAMVMSAIGTANDEARISLFLGFDWWVLPSVVVVALLVLAVWSSRALRLNLVTNLISFVVVAAALTIVVAADGQLPGGDGVSILNSLSPEPMRRD